MTVVQNYSTYWVRKLLLTLTAVEADIPTTTVHQEPGESTEFSPSVTPLAQTTVVSSSASTPLTTTKPISQVTSNNLLPNANARVTRIDIYTAHNGGYNETTTRTYNNSFDDIGNLDTSKNISSPTLLNNNTSSTPVPVTGIYDYNETSKVAITNSTINFNEANQVRTTSSVLKPVTEIANVNESNQVATTNSALAPVTGDHESNQVATLISILKPVTKIHKFHETNKEATTSSTLAPQTDVYTLNDTDQIVTTSSTLKPVTEIYNLNESNQVNTNTDVTSLDSKVRITTSSQIYDNTDYTNNNTEDDFLNYKPMYETTPSDTVDYKRVEQFSTGQYVSVNHRTKANNSEMPTTIQSDLMLFDKENVDQILSTEPTVIFDRIGTTSSISHVDSFNLNSNTNGSGDINELDKWTNSYDQLNWTRDDLNTNNESISFNEPQRTTNPVFVDTIKDTWSQSLRITELPLSDPDRIFEVTKQILQKDSNDVVTFEELITPLDIAEDNFTSNVNKLNVTTSSFTRNAFDFTVNTTEKSPEMIFSTKSHIIETTTLTVTNITLEITTENYNNVVSSETKSAQTDTFEEPKILEWNMSTAQPSFTTEGGSASTTLTEMVSKWMREHIHDIPDPVSTAASEPDVSKSKDDQDSKQNETKSVKHLDSRNPKIEVKI